MGLAPTAHFPEANHPGDLGTSPGGLAPHSLPSPQVGGWVGGDRDPYLQAVLPSVLTYSEAEVPLNNLIPQALPDQLPDPPGINLR